MEQNPFPLELKRYKPYLSEKEFDQLVSDAYLEAPSAVRVNLLKNEQPKEFLRHLIQKYGWDVQTLPFSDDSVQILSYSKSPGQTIEHKTGAFYIQDAASILPVSLFTPTEKPQLVLDMAASPGGKTTQLIDLGRDRDFIIANDSSSSRIPALKTVLQSWGASNFAITNFPGEKWGDWYPETFDRILLDAPCSMQSLRVSESHPHRPISDDERTRLASRQSALLFSAAKALKTGGELVYSTCTLSPEEDEAVLSGLLNAYPDSLQNDPAFANRWQAFGLTEFAGVQFHPDVRNALRIWPFIFQTNGFFAVKLKKIKSLTGEDKAKTNPPQRNTDWTLLKAASKQLLFDYFDAKFAFSLENLLSSRSLDLYWRGEEIWLLPITLLTRFPGLPVKFSGLPIGQFIRQNFEPSPDFFHAFGQFFKKGFWEIPQEHEENWMKGYDLRGLKLDGFAAGDFIAIRDKDGTNLGAAKYSKERLRNLLPNRHLIH